jgi:hypothetical protein|tara:strand:+ start:53 stop:280 length:228 start_codon:yes stop_codon:yes gene_type:complete
MKAILEFNLPDDQHEFIMASEGEAMNSVIWDMDQWLRGKIKHAPDSVSDDTLEAYQECRDQLHELLNLENITLDK